MSNSIRYASPSRLFLEDTDGCIRIPIVLLTTRRRSLNRIAVPSPPRCLVNIYERIHDGSEYDGCDCDGFANCPVRPIDVTVDCPRFVGSSSSSHERTQAHFSLQ